MILIVRFGGMFFFSALHPAGPSFSISFSAKSRFVTKNPFTHIFANWIVYGNTMPSDILKKVENIHSNYSKCAEISQKFGNRMLKLFWEFRHILASFGTFRAVQKPIICFQNARYRSSGEIAWMLSTFFRMSLSIVLPKTIQFPLKHSFSKLWGDIPTKLVTLFQHRMESSATVSIWRRGGPAFCGGVCVCGVCVGGGFVGVGECWCGWSGCGWRWRLVMSVVVAVVGDGGWWLTLLL